MIDVMVKNVGAPLSDESIHEGLEALQKIVCGYIETVRIAPGIVMAVNEEGKLRRLPLNFECVKTCQAIVGNVVFTAHDENGEGRSLSDADRAVVRQYMGL